MPISKLHNVWRDGQGQDQYLMRLFMTAGLVGGLPKATTGGQLPAAATAAGSTSKGFC
jgi:hypothetical protein